MASGEITADGPVRDTVDDAQKCEQPEEGLPAGAGRIR